MTDNDKNMRTLVLCFVLAILALIPLRFAEIGNQMASVSTTQVLGETTEQSEIILPNGELSN